ncbi:MAG: hypothetical protein EB059_09415 [Alphaproteobacteria bacterium]|nr:hypothetical protein [Alphaproteobacteria bacterium]
MTLRITPWLGLMILCATLWAGPVFAQARNAAFVNPNSANTKLPDGKAGSSATTVVADPAAIDAGETLVNVARRITVFFYNGFRSPIQVNELTLNADGNVRSKIVSDDCTAIKTLPVQDKCSVALEITPSSPGPWSVELLMNHSGLGRIARAEVNGSTLGKADEKAEGLAISKKIAVPLDFGSVMAYEEKAARTMLIENDSTAPLLISSIDLIGASDAGLSLRSTGCKEGEALKPGESCPVTVIWEPKSKGNVATDLIIRHNGNLGFVVVPIRGAATGGTASGTAVADNKDNNSDSKSASTRKSNPNSMMPRSSDAASQMRASTPALDALPLPQRLLSPDASASSKGSSSVNPPSANVAPVAPAPPAVALIGTVGARAILTDADEQTYMVGLGEKVNIQGADVELMQLDPTRAVVMLAGQRINLLLRSAPTVSYNKAAQSGTGSQPHGMRAQKNDAVMPAPRPATLDGSVAPPLPPAAPSGPGLGGASNSMESSNYGTPQAANGATAQDVLNLIK